MAATAVSASSDRDDRGDDRAEREEQDEQRDRHREQLGAVEVAVDDAVARVARRDVAGLLDRHLRVRGAARPGRGARMFETSRTVSGVTTTSAECRSGDELLPVGAERLADHAVAHDARGDVARSPPGTADPRRAACRCAGRRTRARAGQAPLLVDQLVAARRLADRAVLERLGPGRDERADRERDEREPAADRQPGPARAPAPDRGDRPHVATLRRGHARCDRRSIMQPRSAVAATRSGRRAGELASMTRRLNLCRASPEKGSASRWRFHPPLPLAFRLGLAAFPVRPSDAASTYSRSVLAARANL